MDNAILEAQLVSLEGQLALAPAGSPQAAAIQAQISTLQIELDENPVVPHMFPHIFPHFHGK
jgi:hypothetical protein